MIAKYIQSYIRLVYFYYSCIRVYKRNLTEKLLLKYILYMLVYTLQYIIFPKVHMSAMSTLYIP